MKTYRLNIGITVKAHERSCLFCEHCTDIFYDSQGIYLTICAKDADIYEGASGDCSQFENEVGE